MDPVTATSGGQPIEAIYIDGATIQFKAGDKPKFTGTPRFSLYTIDHERGDTGGSVLTGMTVLSKKKKISAR